MEIFSRATKSIAAHRSKNPGSSLYSSGQTLSRRGGIHMERKESSQMHSQPAVTSARLGVSLAVALLLLAACRVTSMPPPSAANLGGTSWQLVKFQGSDDSTLTPDDKAKYTIEFATDGGLAARIDCNRGRGTWKSSGANLELGALALTRAMCPPGSLHDRIVKDWSLVRSYVIKQGHLFLALMADGGIYEFEPIGG